MGAVRRTASHAAPSAINWPGGQRGLQPRQQRVFLVADVLAQQCRDAIPQRVVAVAVGQHPPRNGPQHRFLGEGMRKHKAAQPVQQLLALGAGGAVDRVQQAVELDMVALLTGENAVRTTELADCLVGEGRHGGATYPLRTGSTPSAADDSLAR
ncbi:hypothetical protein ASG82_11520 [Mycobacterium sp. Soil538]|nr:hypothetical protein ASG82_11520 [Mycobacterium sp. Soil538]